MKMIKDVMCIVRDIVVIICFTILSISFDKWWIIFFSILFMTHWKKHNKTLGEDDENS